MSQLNSSGREPSMTSTATTTKFTLTAITDDSIKKVHLGAKEREAGKTWCGVQLLVPGDKRFGGRYKDIVWEEILKTSPEGSTDDSDGQPDLEAVTCGACKRSAPWKAYEISHEAVYTPAAPKPKAAPKPRTTAKVDAGPKAGTISANEAQEMANRDAEAAAAKAAAPSKQAAKGGRPRKSAATRKAEQAAKDAAKLAAGAVSGSSVIEPDPETGLPRIKPEIEAKAALIAAGQVAANEEAAEQERYEAEQAAAQDAAAEIAADDPQSPEEFIATVTNIAGGAK
jgi:hypothetical protein